MSAERYHAKRRAGIAAGRTDGSVTSPLTDEQAGAAERFAAEMLGAPFNDEIYDTHGDGGHDFKVVGDSGNEYTCEVVWLGYVAGTEEPRQSGHLVVNPYEPQRWADVYISVAGSTVYGFRLVGWCRHEHLTRGPLKDFGFGPKFAVHTDDLQRFRKVA